MPRQTGKSTTVVSYLLHYALFNDSVNIGILANKASTARELLGRLSTAYENLPKWMQQGILVWNKGNIELENGSKILAASTSASAVRGMSFNILFLDEFAFVPNHVAEQFFASVYPTITSGKSTKVIIISTPNGMNHFYKMWEDARRGKNDYTTNEVHWSQVPGRDEEWKKREIANLGSEEAFNQQYGCQFLSASSLLLSSEELTRLEKDEKEFIFHEIDPLDDLCLDYSALTWDPEFDIEEIENPDTFFTFAIDLAEGVGRDHTVINMFKVEAMDDKDIDRLNSPGSLIDLFRLTQVGVFRSNLHNLEDFSKILYTLCVKFFDQENLRLIIEYNTYGSELIKNLVTLYPNSNDFDEETIVRYHHRVGARTKSPGIRINKDNKVLYCEKLKNLISNGQLILKDKRTISEARMFSRNSNGTYSAQSGNDDIMMTCVTTSSFFDTLDFSEIIEEYFDTLETTKQKRMDGLLDSDGNSDSLYDMFG